MSQILLPRIGGGRIAAFEILIANYAVRNLIREGKTFQLPNTMQLSSKDGMQTLDQVLADLVKKRIVNEEVAKMASSNPEHLKRLLSHTESVFQTLEQ